MLTIHFPPRAVKFPLRSKLCLKHVLGAMIGVFCIVMTTVGPRMYYMKHIRIQKDEKITYVCSTKFPTTESAFFFSLSITTLFGFIPIIAIALFHILIWREIRNKPKMESASEENKRQEKIRKVSKMFYIIFIVYFIMTLPHALTAPVFWYCFGYNKEYFNENRHTLVAGYNITVAVLFFNSCVNAFIYGKAHSKLWKLWKRSRGNI